MARPHRCHQDLEGEGEGASLFSCRQEGKGTSLSG